MTRRAVLAVLALIVGLGTFGCGSGGNPANESGTRKMTKANYDRIKVGMTVAEVEAILGKAAHTATRSGAMLNGPRQSAAQVKMTDMTWVDGKKIILVTFDQNDRLVIVAQQNL